MPNNKSIKAVIRTELTQHLDAHKLINLEVQFKIPQGEQFLLNNPNNKDFLKKMTKAFKDALKKQCEENLLYP